MYVMTQRCRHPSKSRHTRARQRRSRHLPPPMPRPKTHAAKLPCRLVVVASLQHTTTWHFNYTSAPPGHACSRPHSGHTPSPNPSREYPQGHGSSCRDAGRFERHTPTVIRIAPTTIAKAASSNPNAVGSGDTGSAYHTFGAVPEEYWNALGMPAPNALTDAEEKINAGSVAFVAWLCRPALAIPSLTTTCTLPAPKSWDIWLARFTHTPRSISTQVRLNLKPGS